MAANSSFIDTAANVIAMMVSPTRALFSSLMPAITNPTSPADSPSRCTALGVNTPTCSHR
jgi:hypothetical protein